MGKVVQTCVNPECGKVMGVQSRGLCRDCWRTPEIWAKFKHVYAQRNGGRENVETMAELDAIEAEQRRCLPPWWNESDPDEEDDSGVVPWVVPFVILKTSRVDKKGRDR